MEPFPFTVEEWSCVGEVTLALINATFAEDAILHASLVEELRYVLDELRAKYGQHPALLETEADFTDEPSERVALYEQAKQAALAGGWVTYSIRISLARVLLEELGDVERAMQELVACRDEVTACADESERQEWQELQKECIRRTWAESEGGG
jgi:hypothetical protein